MCRKSQIVLILVGIFLQLSTVYCWSEPDSEIILSHDLIQFHLVSGQASPVDADIVVRIIVQSSKSGWVLNYQANPLIGLEGEIPPDRIQVKTPYSNGFEGLDLPRLVGRGDDSGTKPDEVATIQFRYMATGQEKPGTYEGTIFSSDGAGPPIHVRIVIAPAGEEAKPYERKAEGTEHELKAERTEPGPLVKMTLSPQDIRFPVISTPAEYDADNAVVLTVESKDRFMVTARATSLHSHYGDIPPDRLLVNPGNGNYYSLEKDVVVLEALSKVPEKEKPVSADLRFRLKTLWDDKAGEYAGEIVFTCMPGE